MMRYADKGFFASLRMTGERVVILSAAKNLRVPVENRKAQADAMESRPYSLLIWTSYEWTRILVLQRIPRFNEEERKQKHV